MEDEAFDAARQHPPAGPAGFFATLDKQRTARHVRLEQAIRTTGEF
jgi:hypothetical protein